MLSQGEIKKGYKIAHIVCKFEELPYIIKFLLKISKQNPNKDYDKWLNSLEFDEQEVSEKDVSSIKSLIKITMISLAKINISANGVVNIIQQLLLNAKYKITDDSENIESLENNVLENKTEVKAKVKAEEKVEENVVITNSEENEVEDIMFNSVSIMGRITKDLELGKTNNGVVYCSFQIANERKYKDKDGKKITDFYNVEAWKQNAEFIVNNFSKGSMIGIEGELKTSKYKNKTGDKEIEKVVIQVENVSFCGEKPKEKKEQNNNDDEEFTRVNEDNDIPDFN